MIGVDDFADFFEAVHGPGVKPFSWQVDLLRQLVDKGCWPEQVVAPTGAGKSSVVEVHIFATALSAVDSTVSVPRRLAVVVNRRALTDSHAERARSISRLLSGTPADGDVLSRVRDALVSLRLPGAAGQEPLVVATMRGAALTDRAWLNAPEACAVLCMTPAMWASGLLFRSYGASRLARPRLAGMLAMDAVMVLDEAHLSRQVLETARRAGELCAPGAERLGVKGLQVVEMTATPSSEARVTIGVTRDQLSVDKRLAARVQAPKTARYVPTVSFPLNGKMTSAYRDVVVGEVKAAVERARALVPEGPRTVGCVLNRVDRAVQVADALAKQGLSCRLWVGRMRPWDLERMMREEPGLFDPRGEQGVDVLVSTQTIEVGVDLDLAEVVTELASASALAQRAGRVNRLGLRSQSALSVIGPSQEVALTKDLLPYKAADLEAGRKWLLEREAGGDLSPLAVSEAPPPAAVPSRVLWQRPEPWDLALWSKTSMRLVVEPELDLWIRDDLEPEVGAAGIVLRNFSDLLDTTACESLVRAVPPQEREVYPVRIGTVRSVLKRLAAVDRRLLETSVLWRDEEVLADWQAVVMKEEDPGARVLRPGDVLVLDANAQLLTQGVVTESGSSQGEPVPAEYLEGVAAVVTDPDELSRLAALEDDERERLFPGEIWQWPAGWDGSESPGWLVRRVADSPDDESEERSAWSCSRRVLLEDHGKDVALRARQMAQAVGLDDELSEVLRQAGEWHDVGKADARFQKLLYRGDASGKDLLAKSGGRPMLSVRRAWADAGLPPGWRHELASAAAYWEHAQTEGVPVETRDLVARLVGTSHGRGRPLFDHDPVTAGPQHAQGLEVLVGEGEWEALIARSGRLWGPWATAYLEALLRAADCTISAEGK